MGSKTSMWMPIYIGDYLGDTQRLTTEQHGAYFLIILDYWRSGPPPDDDTILRQITRLDDSGWSRNKAALIGFFSVKNGHWRHKRIDEELQRAVLNKDKLTDRAKKGAAARWGTDQEPMLEALLDECPSPSPSPSLSESPSTSGEGIYVGPEQIVDAWNAMAKPVNLPCISRLTDSRRTHLKARLAEHEGKVILEAIAKVPQSEFLMGSTGWKANLDSMIRPDNMAKLIEGAYHGRSGGKPSGWLA